MVAQQAQYRAKLAGIKKVRLSTKEPTAEDVKQAAKFAQYSRLCESASRNVGRASHASVRLKYTEQRTEDLLSKQIVHEPTLKKSQSREYKSTCTLLRSQKLADPVRQARNDNLDLVPPAPSEEEGAECQDIINTYQHRLTETLNAGQGGKEGMPPRQQRRESEHGTKGLNS